MKELVYNVYHYNVNKDTIEPFNIFQSTDLSFCALKRLRKACVDKRTFLVSLKAQLRYIYSGRCEHEVVISGWPSGNTTNKVSVYDQIMLNWSLISDYVWRELNEDICCE